MEIIFLEKIRASAAPKISPTKFTFQNLPSHRRFDFIDMARLLDLSPELIHEILSYLILFDQLQWVELCESINSSRNPPRNPNGNGMEVCRVTQSYALSKVSTGSFIKEINRLGHALDSAPWGNVWPGGIDRHLTKHRCHQKSLLSISLACRRLYMSSLPILWSMVEIDLYARLRMRPLIVGMVPLFVKSHRKSVV